MAHLKHFRFQLSCASHLKRLVSPWVLFFETTAYENRAEWGAAAPQTPGQVRGGLRPPSPSYSRPLASATLNLRTPWLYVISQAGQRTCDHLRFMCGHGGRRLTNLEAEGKLFPKSTLFHPCLTQPKQISADVMKF